MAEYLANIFGTEKDKKSRISLARDSIVSSFHTSKWKSDYSIARSKISSTLGKLFDYQKEKKSLRKKLPAIISILQGLLTVLNFGLFSVYVLLFGVTVSSIFTAISEDCLKAPPNYKIPPEEVVPNTLTGYECTGIRLIEDDDYFQIFLLVILTIAIALQLLSSNLAFIGSATLTVKNIKIGIALFVISTIVLMTFFILDVVLEKGKQYLKFFGAYNRGFLIIMLVIAISHVLSGFISILLLVNWNSMLNKLNKDNR